jgi:hypothetical protein
VTAIPAPIATSAGLKTVRTVMQRVTGPASLPVSTISAVPEGGGEHFGPFLQTGVDEQDLFVIARGAVAEHDRAEAADLEGDCVRRVARPRQFHPRGRAGH